MVELVDTLDLGSNCLRSASSSLAIPTLVDVIWSSI